MDEVPVGAPPVKPYKVLLIRRDKTSVDHISGEAEVMLVRPILLVALSGSSKQNKVTQWPELLKIYCDDATL